MAPKIVIETKTDFNSYLRLMYTLIYQKPLMIIMTILGFLFLLVPLLYFAGLLSFFSKPPWFILAFGLGTSLILPYSIYRQLNRIYNKNKALQEKIIYIFNQAGMDIIGETFRYQIPWEKINKIRSVSNWLMIYHDESEANIIPKASFDEIQLQSFQEMVKSYTQLSF